MAQEPGTLSTPKSDAQWIPMTPPGGPSDGFSFPREMAVSENAQDNQDGSPPGNLAADQKSVHSTASERRRPTWTPSALQWWRTIPLGLTFIVIAISSEVVLISSQKNSGFDIHLTDTELSRGKQFLKSFGPSIIFTPLFLWFGSSYDAIKLLQPYIDMSRDNAGAMASQSVLVDYLARGPTSAFLESFRKRHWIVFILSYIAIWSGVFSSLAGSYFQIISVSQQLDTTVSVTGKVGQGIANLTNIYIPFVTAAGSLDAALRTGAIASPYLLNDSDRLWMVPSFTLTDLQMFVQGGNVSTKLSAVNVQARCAPAQAKVTGIDAQDLYEIVGTLPNGCSATSYALTTQVGSWFGWPVTTAFDCVHSINPNETESTDLGDFYRPVAFAFFKNISMYSMVFCYSTVVEHDIVAKLGFSAQNIGVFEVLDKGAVTSLGFGPNGLNFPNPYNSSRVTGVGDSVKYTLSDAIIQYAGFQEIGAGISTSRQDEILSSSTLTAEYAQTAYLYYQAFVAQSTFVVGTVFQQPATYNVPTYRLVANKPVSHALTVLCGITGVSLIAIFLYHHMGRGDVWLGAEPSGIATVAALLSRSRFPAHVRLHPSDSIEEIQAKLGGLRFKMLPTGGVDMAESNEKA